MAESDSKTLQNISKKLSEASENTVGSVKKLGGNINDAFKATFADSPLIGGLVDIGQSLGSDVLGMFGGTKKEPLTDAEVEASEQREAQQEELQNITDEIASLRDVGETAEDRRENNRKADDLLQAQQDIAASLANFKLEGEDDKGGWFDAIKDNLVLTMTGLVTFLKSPLKSILGFFKPLSGVFGKLFRVLGPIGLAIGVIIGAFTGFGKATEIFGKNATILEKISATIGGILSGLTFGLVDTKTFAVWVKSFLGFFTEHFKPAFDSIGNYVMSIIGMFKSIFGLAKALFSGDSADISKAWETMKTAFGTYFKAMFSMVGEVINAIVTLPLKVMTVLWDAILNIGTWLTGRAKVIWPVIKEGLAGVFDPIGKWIGEGIADMVDGLSKWINDTLVGLILSLPGGETIAKNLGLDTSGSKERAEQKKIVEDRAKKGSELYYSLQRDGGGLKDNRSAFSESTDTMSVEDIGKLSAEQAILLKETLLSKDEAGINSKIIQDLQAQADKLKREEMRQPATGGNTVVNAPSNTSNTTNVIGGKGSARTPDQTMKFAPA